MCISKPHFPMFKCFYIPVKRIVWTPAVDWVLAL